MNFIDGTLDSAGHFSSPGMSLDLDLEMTGDGRTVVLGIRPEHLLIVAGGPFEGKVALVEPMGNHQVVWIAVGARKLSAIVNDNRELKLGDPVRFAIAADRVSLFDKATEQRLNHP